MNLLDFIFPKFCLSCRKRGRYICQNCLSKVRSGRAFYFRENGLGMNISIFRYEGVIRKAIHAVKYKFAYSISGELAHVCIALIKANKRIPSKAVLVPIPLHKKRKNWRGFNQSEILGRELSRHLGWEFSPNLLVVKKETLPQVGLTRENRLRNTSGKYAVNSNYLIPKLSKIILFDDVWTTGSTMKEAYRVLKEFGFKNVWAVTIAS